ncbi:MAG TPA: adenylosuccinate lyase [Acidimicrobiales bacterium]|nr:adenylosuccinate lyase [Acidimicrobiales bacterium]
MSTGAISPLDGRYAAQAAPYARLFSEEALFRRRMQVEVEWFLTLASLPEVTELPPVDPGTEAVIRRWVEDFGPADVERIKQVERRINHDVKAVEYHLKERLSGIGLGSSAEFVHFGCTSEDVNNLAYALMLDAGLRELWLPDAWGLVDELWRLAVEHASLPMPSHTHGQPASPTTLGKELAVFAQRLGRHASAVASTELTGKFNGAVGTFAAHVAAYPEVDWVVVSKRFVESFGFAWNPLTTQIEPHDTLAEVFDAVARFNTVLIDFCRDMWEYTSRSLLAQRPVEGEVGSSTMPHKVNPIDFENAEANAGVSTALLRHLSSKLPISRMQRDLSDSSALRNVGVAVAHSGLAISSARRGLARVAPAPEAMAAALDSQWEVLAEAVQTVMRRHGLPEPYERLKELTRGREVGAAELRAFIGGLGLPQQAADALCRLTPSTYTGLAAELVLLGKKGEPSRPASGDRDR